MKIGGFFIFALILVTTAGCSAMPPCCAKKPTEVDVFGVQLHSDRDYREINGVKGEDEPCIRGCDRSFDALDISIGYGFDKKIRKITTRNTETGMFGIHPGMKFPAGREMILRAGFKEHSSPYRYRSDKYSLTFLVDAEDTIFGLTLEPPD